ncbi:MAG TPA: 2-amino-4-hydroxy-6-hydroxymethyldihydropteridine diphosphokinase [Paludibacter sp.]
MNRFIILLASNSEAEKNMEIARKLLIMNFPESIRFSENHWSAAIVAEGHEIPQGELSRYLNAVCVVQSENTLDTIQVFLKKMELEMGRVRGVEAQGRVLIDLDLVEWNGAVLRPKDAAQEYFNVCLRDL